MNRVAFSLFGKDIYWYGIIIACALIIGVFLGVKEAKRRGYRSEMILDFMLIAIPVCVICARIYYVVSNGHRILLIYGKFLQSGKADWRYTAQ